MVQQWAHLWDLQMVSMYYKMNDGKHGMFENRFFYTRQVSIVLIQRPELTVLGLVLQSVPQLDLQMDSKYYKTN